MTPKQWRAGGRGEVIHFALAASSLGSVLVASSATGVVAILLGDDPETLLQSLQQRFRQAELVGADRGYEQLVAQVVGLVEDPREARHCRWISAAPPSSSGYGRHCGRFRADRPPRMPISPRASARPLEPRRGPMHARAIHWRWRCPATAWSGATATCPATPGAWHASANCCAGKTRHTADTTRPPSPLLGTAARPSVQLHHQLPRSCAPAAARRMPPAHSPVRPPRPRGTGCGLRAATAASRVRTPATDG